MKKESVFFKFTSALVTIVLWVIIIIVLTTLFSMIIYGFISAIHYFFPSQHISDWDRHDSDSDVSVYLI